MGFKIPNKNTYTPSSPIELFNTLGKIERLSLQQGQSLEEYEEMSNKYQDIAIEMPAGHGKTLVGGLIAEFKRLKEKWRVVYCCATRQLAAQTHSLLDTYGIKSVLLTGKSRDFPEKDYGKYNRSGAVAVTTYSHIFNINSAFDDVNLIIFDDAHATEYSINDFWSFELTRNEEQDEVFRSLYTILQDAIPKHVQDTIENGMYDPLTDGINIIPQPLWINKLEDVRSYLDQATQNNNLYFSWSKIRNILHGCNIFIKHNNITIKPVVPPNELHSSFNDVNERIYMSATLGPIGELERIFGVKKISRISKFSKGANKVSGRRLILFPEDHFENEMLIESVLETIKMQPRALLLFPTNQILYVYKEFFEENLPDYEIFLSSDVEESLQDFKNCDKGLLFLAGRYEGIDLKDDDCRLQIFIDLPIAVGMSEQFLQTRLKASEVLKNRLVTRITQGLGRCTRGTNDYAAVLFLGKRVGEFLYKNDFRKLLPPEIDAELEFGFQQIDNINNIDSWKSALNSFFEQKEEWVEVENYIKETTHQKQIEHECTKTDDPIESCAIHEVEFQYKLLEKDFEKAHKSSDEIIKLLARNQLYNGYRAWWNYNISCVSYQQGNTDKSNEFLTNALKASFNKTWIDKDLLNLNVSKESIYSTEIEMQLENIISTLMEYGDRDKRFEKDWTKVLNGLSERKAELFESSLSDFGEFLGMSSTRPTGKGTPDGVWYFMKYWAVFEAKTNIKDASKGIPLDDIRQAGYHNNWVRTNMDIPKEVEIISCIICEREFIEDYAKHTVDDLYLISPESLRTKAENFGIILRGTIQKLKFSTEIDAKDFLAKHLIENELTIEKLMNWLKKIKLKDIIEN